VISSFSEGFSTLKDSGTSKPVEPDLETND